MSQSGAVPELCWLAHPSRRPPSLAQVGFREGSSEFGSVNRAAALRCRSRCLRRYALLLIWIARGTAAYDFYSEASLHRPTGTAETARWLKRFWNIDLSTRSYAIHFRTARSACPILDIPSSPSPVKSVTELNVNLPRFRVVRAAKCRTVVEKKPPVAQIQNSRRER